MSYSMWEKCESMFFIGEFLVCKILNMVDSQLEIKGIVFSNNIYLS